MVRAGNCKVICILLWLCFFTSAASADLQNATLPPAAGGTAAPSEIRVFIPEAGSINSDQINDAINGKNGAEMLFATGFGLSRYNGTWSTRHVTRDNTSEGLLDDFVTALEYDPAGNLWIGYAGGIQIHNGRTYLTIRDQQVLKDTRIKALQRWDDSMWVATGNSGIHRFRNGSWSWFQPLSKGGPGFYEVDSMAVDPESNALMIATVREGIWRINSSSDPVVFDRIDQRGDLPAPLLQVRQNPLGGVYLFDGDSVSLYGRNAGLVPVLSARDLTSGQTVINDIAAAPDGTLYLGTDDGIYIWQEGSVSRHLGRFEGIGTSPVVRRVFADAQGRVWFSSQGSVGFYRPTVQTLPVVTIQLMNVSFPADTPPTETTPAPPVPAAPAVAEQTIGAAVTKQPSLLEHLATVLSEIFSKFRT